MVICHSELVELRTMAAGEASASQGACPSINSGPPLPTFRCHPREKTVSQLPFLSFRASEARHGIQYFQQVLDAGFRRHDGVDSTFYYYDTVSKAGIQFLSHLLNFTSSQLRAFP